MEGAALRRKQEIDLATYTAWHVAVFGLGMYAGKMKGKALADFIQSEKPDKQPLQYARAIAFFQRLKAQGVSVEITRH
jgi:hypothetical protein